VPEDVTEGSTSAGGQLATGRIAYPVTPEDWDGQCVVGATMALAGEVVSEEACELHMVKNEIGVINVSGGPMPARCVSASLDAASVYVEMTIYGNEIAWGDILTGGDGGTSYDPPRGDTRYELVRRAP
jgi:hypothetical protein